MQIHSEIKTIINSHIAPNDHGASDYFSAIKELVRQRNNGDSPEEKQLWQEAVETVYSLVRDEITTNTGKPLTKIKFGTSGWRGMLGKDINVHTVACVTAAILSIYADLENNPELQEASGIRDFDELRRRGCVIGFDNRFCGDLLALSAVNVLAANKIRIFYAGEATTGALSASVLERQAAFSINLTPSHNPLEYGGFKYNAADAGPAAPILTDMITEQSRRILEQGRSELLPETIDLQRSLEAVPGLERENALASWQNLVRRNEKLHGLDYDSIIIDFATKPDLVIAIDCVHGAARVNIADFFKGHDSDRLIILRGEPDVTFGGIAPEPSSANMAPVTAALRERKEPLKIGVIIDPDGDRIRFTDGTEEISMNHFGAMAYHFIHQVKNKTGMVAKTVATSNLANAIAASFNEKVFEPRVGFKEFKPVMGRALVYFEESDGISVIGHTPEKDAYIGLLLAMDMVLTLGKNLSEYLAVIEDQYGTYYPARDSVTVSQQGSELMTTLAGLAQYAEGTEIRIGDKARRIREVITIDGRKMILDDNSWIMIRPSGTEPKVRFYVEARSGPETALLVKTAKSMLAEIGLLA
ncbi:MAG: phosphoglucomutase [Desulfobulbaceae bacterium]|nr:phosphoglucomutase [Desulfobulbaceae bacterium]